MTGQWRKNLLEGLQGERIFWKNCSLDIEIKVELCRANVLSALFGNKNQHKLKQVSHNLTGKQDGGDVMIWFCFAAIQGLVKHCRQGVYSKAKCVTICLTNEAWAKLVHETDNYPKHTTKSKA